MPSRHDPGKFWRDRADAARREAVLILDDGARRQMYEIAASYDRLAQYVRDAASELPAAGYDARGNIRLLRFPL
jgi:hypothetical protein